MNINFIRAENPNNINIWKTNN